MPRLVPLITLLIYLISSCTNELTTENIVGTWKITDFTSNSEISPQILHHARALAITGTYEFMADGSSHYTDDYSAEIPFDRTWDLNPDTKEIRFKTPTSTTNYQISSFTKNKMIWVEDMGEMGSNEYTLRKVQ